MGFHMHMYTNKKTQLEPTIQKMLQFLLHQYVSIHDGVNGGEGMTFTAASEQGPLTSGGGGGSAAAPPTRP
jgi:hypothetical protein